LKVQLDNKDSNYSILEKANTRFGYLFKGKRSIKRQYVKRLYDKERDINQITGGLPAKEYIAKYLPEEPI